MSRNKCFSCFEYHMFYVLYPLVTCLLTLLVSTCTGTDVYCHQSVTLLLDFRRSRTDKQDTHTDTQTDGKDLGRTSLRWGQVP
jgi:hypothetical protein